MLQVERQLNELMEGLLRSKALHELALALKRLMPEHKGAQTAAHAAGRILQHGRSWWPLSPLWTMTLLGPQSAAGAQALAPAAGSRCTV